MKYGEYRGQVNHQGRPDGLGQWVSKNWI